MLGRIKTLRVQIVGTSISANGRCLTWCRNPGLRVRPRRLAKVNLAGLCRCPGHRSGTTADHRADRHANRPAQRTHAGTGRRSCGCST
jgi:hypothetical protein